MTKGEKAKIRRIIKTLNANDGNYAVALAELCRMVGWRYPAGELGDLKTLSISDLTALPEHDFEAPED